MFERLNNAQDSQYSIALEDFTDEFVQAYGDNSFGEPEDESSGHPASLSHYVCNSLLSSISLDIGTDSVEALEFLTSSKYKSKKVDIAVASMPVFKNLEASGQQYDSAGNVEAMKAFLRTVHLLSIISKWKHNRTVINKQYGPAFVGILTEALRSLTGEINGAMLMWGQAQDNRASPGISLVYLTNAIISTAIGLCQTVTRFACSDQELAPFDISVGSVPSQPWEVSEFSARGMHLFLRTPRSGKTSPSDGPPSPRRPDGGNSAPLSPTRGTARANSANMGDSKAQEKTNTETVQVLVSLLWKLHDLANVLATTLTEGESDPLSLRALRTMLLVLQSQVLYSLSVYLVAFPVLVKPFRAAEGHGVVQSLLTVTDFRLGQTVHKTDAELLMQRCMLVLHCQDVGMEANVKMTKNATVPVADLERTLLNLKPVFIWLSKRCEEEAAAQEDDFFSERVVSQLYVECKCPQILRTKLPNTDVYPWDAGISASAMHCGNMTTRQETACSALTNVFKAFWAQRRNSFPIDGVQVFEPSKTLLYSLTGSDPDYGSSNLTAESAVKHHVPFFTEYLSLPAARMMNHLLSKIFLVVWKYTRTTYSLPDKMIYIKAALKMLSEAVETCVSSSYSVAFLMHYMLFIGRCIRYSPQQMILVCRSQKVWKLLLKLGGITSAKNAHIFSAEFSNKFMNVSSTLAGTDEIAPPDSPIDDLVYQVMWRYSSPDESGNIMLQSNSTSGGNQVPFSPSQKIQFASSTDEHDTDASASADTSDSHSRPHSIDFDSQGQQSPGIFSRKKMDVTSSEHDISFSTIQSEDVDSPKSPKSPKPVYRVNGGATEKEEFLLFFSQYVLKDMIMELIRICSHFSFLVHALVDTSVDAHLFLEYEATELTEALTADTTDDSIILIIRWLSDLADFHNQIFIQSSIWTNATKKCIALSKSLLDSLNTFVASTASYSGDILQARPLFWPARAATVQLISKIIYSPCSKDWLDAFIPKLDDAQAPTPTSAASSASSAAAGNNTTAVATADAPDRRQSMSASLTMGLLGRKPAVATAASGPLAVNIPAPNVNSASNISRPVRHSVIIRLILDPLCRDYAVSIIAKLLQTCAEVLHGLPLESSITKITKQSMIEALSHDVIKGLLNTMIAAPQQPEVNDGVGAVILSIQALIVLLRNPVSLSGGREQLFPHAAYQKLFTNYGTLTPSHALLGWNYSRYNIFRDLLASLNASFKRASNWDNSQKRKVMHYSLAFMTAIMADNDVHKETFWHLLMQKTKKKSSSMAMATSATHSHSYHDLISMLVSCRDGETVSVETVLLLVEMLLDGFSIDFRLALWDKSVGRDDNIPTDGYFDKGAEVPNMTNLSTIPLLLNITYFCSETLQCCIFNTLYNCVGGSNSTCLINLSTCLQMKPPIFDMVLDVFPNLSAPAQRASVKLLQVMGRNTVSVAQLKRLFRLLQLKDGKRPDYTWCLLDAMEGMIVSAQVPRHFFFFQGNESGLRLPPFKKWPAVKGFSFSTWFCIDSPKATTRDIGGRETFVTGRGGERSDLKYNPRLMCFRQDSGLGFELYFKAHDGFPNAFSVMYTVFSSSGAHTVEIGVVSKSRAKGQGWHHLALAHTASNFRSKSELLVLINSKRTQHTISYPRFSDEIRFPTIGDTSPNFKDEGSNTTFFGQVAPLYFFCEPLPEVYLQGVYELGPNYAQLFNDKDGMLGSDSAIQKGPNFARVQDGFLSSSIMLTYNPALRRGNIIIDNTPEKNVHLWRPSRITEEFAEAGESGSGGVPDVASGDATSGGEESEALRKMHSLRLKGTYVFSTRDVRDSFDCLGGVKVLLPLFTQLTNSIETVREAGNLDLQREIYFKILKLHCSFLRGTPENHRLMDQYGFNLLKHFMETLGPQYLTLNALKELIRWAEALHWHEQWQNDFIREVLCNFKLWKFTPFEVQRSLFDYLQSMTLANADRMNSVIGVPALFDALYLFYCGSADTAARPNSTKLKAEENIVLPEWKAHYSLSADDLRRIRVTMVNMAYVMMSTVSAPIEEDVGMLLNYLTLESGPNQIVDVLKIFVQLVNPDKPDLGNRVLSAVCAKAGVNNLLNLIQNANPRVRLYALVCLCTIIHFAVLHGKLPSLPVAPVVVAAEKANTAARARTGSKTEDMFADIDTTVGGGASSVASTPRAGQTNANNRSNFSMRSDLGGALASGATAAADSDNREEHPKESDIFDALGIPASSLTGAFLWIQQKLKAAMKNDVYSKESAERQCYIVFTVLILTMFGLPCKKLVVQIETMYSAMLEVQAAEGGTLLPLHSAPSMTNLSSFAYTAPEDADHTMDQEFDVDTASWRICVPMILPALISLVQLETITSSVRIRLLLRLKGCVNNIDNFDVFLSVPNWQSYLFNCLAAEQSRIDFLDAYRENNPSSSPASAGRIEDIEKEFYECQNIIDVLLTFMSDIHIHSIQFGAPSTSYFTISRPKEVRDIQFHNMATKELLQLMQKDNRKVGCIVLRETISFLRTYATYGYLDGQITGMELLQSTIDALQKEQNTVQSAIVNSTEIIMRRKIMELNLWLLTAFVLDFITLPPAQPSGRESMSRSSYFSPADILSGMPDFSHLLCSPNAPSPVRRASTAGSTSGSQKAINFAVSDSSAETSRARVRSVDFASPSEKSLTEISISELDMSLDFNSSMARTTESQNLPNSSKPFSPDLSRIENGRKERRISAANKSSKHNGKKWRLVESLLNLLGPIGSNTWQSIDRVERFKAAFKVGYRLGRFAMHLMQESVDQIITQPSMTPLTPLKNSNLPAANRNKDALVLRAIDGTFWIILRVLLDLFVQTPFADRDMIEGAPPPVALRALSRLMTLLDWVKDMSRDYYESESIFIVIKLAEVLHSGKQPINSAWSKEALQTITMLLSQQRSKMRDKVGGLSVLAGSSDPVVDNLTLERPSWIGGPPNEDDFTSPGSGSSRNSFSGLATERMSLDVTSPSLKTTGSLDELDNVGDAAEVVIDAINQSLKLRDELAISWNKWNEITEPIMREAMKAEKEMLSSKLNVMGLHKDSQESTRQLEDARRAEDVQLSALSHRVEDLDLRIKTAEAKRTRELVRSEEARRKRCKANWGVVYEELANERGPWGGGALDSSDVSFSFFKFKLFS